MPKVVLHPSAESTPSMTVAEAVGMSDQMADCCIMFTDLEGDMHIAWSKQTDADLAAYGVVLSALAAARLIADD